MPASSSVDHENNKANATNKKKTGFSLSLNLDKTKKLNNSAFPSKEARAAFDPASSSQTSDATKERKEPLVIPLKRYNDDDVSNKKNDNKANDTTDNHDNASKDEDTNAAEALMKDSIRRKEQALLSGDTNFSAEGSLVIQKDDGGEGQNQRERLPLLLAAKKRFRRNLEVENGQDAISFSISSTKPS